MPSLQCWGGEHQGPFSGINLKHFKGTQKPGEETVALPGENGSGISLNNQALLPVPIHLFDFWGGGQRRDKKHKSRGSREERIFSARMV